MDFSQAALARRLEAQLFDRQPRLISCFKASISMRRWSVTRLSSTYRSLAEVFTPNGRPLSWFVHAKVCFPPQSETRHAQGEWFGGFR